MITSASATPLATAFSKIVSPTVDQDIQATGVAQVIAVLATPTAASLAVSAPAVPADTAARRVEAIFVSSELSQATAVRRAFSMTAGAAAAALPLAPASITFPNLGVVLGTCDSDGIQKLQMSDDVAVICGTPQISLIRPQNVSAASAPSGVTWGIERLGVPALWRQGLTGKDITVAHLDTGVDATHPTLKDAVAAFAEFDLSLGQRITPDPAPHDSGQHGTHTAGTIAGRPVDGKNIGVAPGALLHSGLVIEGGNVVARLLAGLDWAIGDGVKIISMSLGFRGFVQDFIPIFQIIGSRGILPVIAVGNEGPGTSRSPGNYTSVVSVGAEDDRPSVAPFSSSQTFARADNPMVPDLVAPGVNVISAAPGKGYQSMSGTSMATPHIAGLAALLWEAKPAATAAQIEQAIYASCRLTAILTSDRANRGEPDARDAFTQLTGIALGLAGTRVVVKKAPTAPTTALRSAKGEESVTKNRARPKRDTQGKQHATHPKRTAKSAKATTKNKKRARDRK